MRVRTLLVTLVVTATCVVTGTAGVPPLARARECDSPKGPLIAYGHSYLASPQIGGAKVSYATLAADALGVKPVIRAADGDTTVDVEKLVRQGPTRWVPGSTDVVLIDSAINDIKQQLPTKTWTASLRRMLATFASAPVPVILLVRPLQVAAPGHPGRDPEVIDAYAQQQREVAGEFSAVRIVDAADGWQPTRDLGGDGIHPDAAGEQHLARAVRSVALHSFCAD